MRGRDVERVRRVAKVKMQVALVFKTIDFSGNVVRDSDLFVGLSRAFVNSDSRARRYCH